MKYLITLSIIVFSITQGAMAQKPEYLDIKNGFNKFELGTTVTQVSKYSSLSKVSSNGKIENYKVGIPWKFKLFNHFPKDVYLSFYKGFLYKTTVELTKPLPYKELEVLDNIVGNYEGLYGEWENLAANDPVMITKGIFGERVVLFFFIYREGKSNPWAAATYISVPIQEAIDAETHSNQ